ncbi:hypothetical protein, partial [Nostoc sp.]|uniref:hypothetical protein n=1 Tax=Nostoc sp. TaxID=1180 RepID=UPI002FFD157D
IDSLSVRDSAIASLHFVSLAMTVIKKVGCSHGFMGNAEFKSPAKLVEQHQKAARDLLARYNSNNLG